MGRALVLKIECQQFQNQLLTTPGRAIQAARSRVNRTHLLRTGARLREKREVEVEILEEVVNLVQEVVSAVVETLMQTEAEEA